MSIAPSIQIFSYPAVFERDEEIFMGVLRRGAFIPQKDLVEFEAALDGGPGDDAIVPSHTDIASAASIHFVGARPAHPHREFGFDVQLPVTERFFERCFMLPMHTALAGGE